MGVISEIYSMLEPYVTIVTSKTFKSVDESLVMEHYLSIKYDKNGFPTPHYPALIEYLRGKSVQAIVVEDKRNLDPKEFPKYLKKNVIGYFNPVFADPNTIRNLVMTRALPFMNVVTYDDMHKFGQRFVYDNLIHSSGSLEEALDEMAVWFKDEDILTSQYSNLIQNLRNND